MDSLLKQLLEAPGISGYESAVAKIMVTELKRSCGKAELDRFGNVIACKGQGKIKIMLASHMDEIGLLVKHVDNNGFINFIKVGGIDDRILLGQRVVIKAKTGDVSGIIGAKPPHLQKDDDRKRIVKHEEMFIDIGSGSKKETLELVSIGDQIIFEPNSGVLSGKLCYGKAIDNRVGCYALLKIMEKVKAKAQVFACATVQEEVGLKGARTAGFKINPDFALALDTSVAGDTPQTKETESALKLGLGCGITIMEACGRGLIVSEKIKDLLVETAKRNKIKYQIDIIDGGMTDGAMIYMNREGVPTGVISIPTRYIHSPTGVFSLEDLSATIDLAIKVVEQAAKDF